MPETGFQRLYLKQTAKTLKELAPGKAVYVVLAAGGETTPDGHLVSPVLMSYLIENGELVGRLPILNISDGFYDLLGKDYLGTVHNDPLVGNMTSVFEMDVDTL